MLFLRPRLPPATLSYTGKPVTVTTCIQQSLTFTGHFILSLGWMPKTGVLVLIGLPGVKVSRCPYLRARFLSL